MTATKRKERKKTLAVVDPLEARQAEARRARDLLTWLSDGSLTCTYHPGSYTEGDKEGTEGRIVFIHHDVDTDPDLTICLSDGDPVLLIIKQLHKAAAHYRRLAGKIAINAVKAGKVVHA
jgi:hypothetical protein